jgi:hypothetical protein
MANLVPSLPFDVKAATTAGLLRRDQTYRVLSGGRDFYVISLNGRAIHVPRSFFYSEQQRSFYQAREQQQREYDRQRACEQVTRSFDRTPRPALVGAA